MYRLAIQLLFAVSLLSLAVESDAGFNYGVRKLKESNQKEAVGSPCKPLHVRFCDKELVGDPDVMEINESGIGPNLCLYTFTFQVSTYKFQFQRVCKRRGFKFGCFLTCACSNECDNSTVANVTKTIVDCCEGFTTSRPSPLELVQMTGQSRSRLYYRGLKKDGCPIAVCPDETTTTDTAETVTIATNDMVTVTTGD